MPTVLIAHASADVYGSDRQLLESLAGLLDAGWDATLCLPATGPLLELIDKVEVRILPFPVLRKAMLRPMRLLGLALRAPVDLVRVIREIRKIRPDVVYVNTVTIPLWIVAARLTRRPVLVHVHEAESALPRLQRFALYAPLLLATAIVANSGSTAKVITAVFRRLEHRTQIVPNGVPDCGPAPADAMLPGQLVVVGRLSPRKGVDVALNAVAALRAQDRDVRLDVCGTVFEGYEWYEDELRQRAEEPDLASAVRFVGYVRPTMPFLARASVVLAPSWGESFGNTAVEAMLAERPVVASHVQGLAEIIDDGRSGLLVPPGDSDALACAIERVLTDPALARRLARRGRSVAVERFSVDRYRQDVVAAVDLLGARSGEIATASEDRGA